MEGLARMSGKPGGVRSCLRVDWLSKMAWIGMPAGMLCSRNSRWRAARWLMTVPAGRFRADSTAA